MKFSKIIGNSSDEKTPALIKKAEDKLTAIFLELASNAQGKGGQYASNIGGDPLVFQLVMSCPHILDIEYLELEELKARIDREKEDTPKEILERYRSLRSRRVLTTAATDSRNFYWCLKFVLDHDLVGLRLVVDHEAFHSVLNHPSRRGARNHVLFNIACDFKVNSMTMEDLKARNLANPSEMFKTHLGDFITLEEYALLLKDPFNPPERLKHFNPMHGLKKMIDPGYKHPGDNTPPMFYAEPELPGDFKRPENVYEYLYKQIPRCPKCGKLGMYKKPKEYKKLEEELKKKEEKEKKKQEQENNKVNKKTKSDDKDPKHQIDGKSDDEQDHSHDHSDKDDKDGKSCCGHQCDECGEGGDSTYIDPFGHGELLDDHYDSDMSEDELAKKLADAANIASKFGGRVPGGLSDELGTLSKPKITWQDIVRRMLRKHREGIGLVDWTRPKNRPLFNGMYLPKRISKYLNCLVLYDCSGSMSKEDIAFGISQVAALDNMGEFFLLPFDTQPYYEDMVKIRRANVDNLRNAKVRGRGGTCIRNSLETYEEHCGKVDIILAITDGFLSDHELKGVNIPKYTDLLWLITSHGKFTPPFGRVKHLHNEF